VGGDQEEESKEQTSPQGKDKNDKKLVYIDGNEQWQAVNDPKSNLDLMNISEDENEDKQDATTDYEKNQNVFFNTEVGGSDDQTNYAKIQEQSNVDLQNDWAGIADDLIENNNNFY
jgi:hypothetical protein